MGKTTYIAKDGKLSIQPKESEEGERIEFRLLVGEITDALNYREFEVVIRGAKEIDLDKDLSRFLLRRKPPSITNVVTS